MRERVLPSLSSARRSSEAVAQRTDANGFFDDPREKCVIRATDRPTDRKRRPSGLAVSSRSHSPPLLAVLCLPLCQQLIGGDGGGVTGGGEAQLSTGGVIRDGEVARRLGGETRAFFCPRFGGGSLRSLYG